MSETTTAGTAAAAASAPARAEAGDAEREYARGRGERAAGDDAAAESSYRRALAARPQYIDAWISLGILLKSSGRLAEAEEAQRRAVALDPANYLARLNLANVLVARGRDADAIDEYRAALEYDPQCAEAHHGLGQLLLARNARAEAVPHFAAALAARPGHFEAALGLGQALVDTYQCEAAIEPLAIAARLRSSDVNAKLWLGRACSGAGQYASAAQEFEAALRADPQHPDALCGLATALIYLGQFSRPRAILDALVAGASCRLYHRFEYATLLLRSGEFREGWRHYESRSIRFGKAPGAPRWQGEDITGKTLFIAREQGLGDEIMFASIIPEILPLARHAVIECDRRLAAIYKRSFPLATISGVDLATPHDAELPDRPLRDATQTDCWIRLGDLPARRRNTPEDFPRHGGYLSAAADRVALWRSRLSQTSLRVGIAWHGGVARTRTRERSITLEELAPLFAVPGVQFVSLQHGPHREELAAFCSRSAVRVEHWQESIDDLDECAALMGALDLVISVCSSVVHLGGALGRPTWCLAPLVPEWRYGHEGESIIWYPAVRMFRQDKSRAWNPVVARARRALLKLPRAATAAPV